MKNFYKSIGGRKMFAMFIWLSFAIPAFVGAWFLPVKRAELLQGFLPMVTGATVALIIGYGAADFRRAGTEDTDPYYEEE